MGYALLVVAQVAGILLIPFGLPGIWLQLLALAAYAWATGWATVGPVALGFILLLAVAAEWIEFSLGGRFARKYGGSRRAAWGAILGGIAGAFVGLPVPVLGSVIGSFLGSFAGAVLFELWAARQAGMRPALRTGWGALLGRLAAVAVKSGIAVAVAAIALLAAV
ncbi:MAG TPA: DUF456 domain-containing protein [Longimicrobiaceae bacterium]|nr:DUF456 domain-containing protein [Longimicrobiaceae bacterium]